MKRIKVSNKVLGFILGLLMLLSITIAASIPAVLSSADEGDKDLTVYFYNTDWGNNVYAYCYEQGGGEIGTGWPGAELTRENDIGYGWFSYTLPADPAEKTLQVIFHNNKDDGPRNEVTIPSTLENRYFNSYRTNAFADAQTAQARNKDYEYDWSGNATRVYFYNSLRWEKVYVYTYATNQVIDEDGTKGDAKYTGNWPGTQMNKDPDRENWYYYDVRQDSTTVPFHVIVNNTEGTQSGDAYLFDKDSLHINVNGIKYKNYEACESVTPLKELPNPEDFYLDFGKYETEEKTVSAVFVNNPSLIAPIVVLSVACAACVALGTVVIIRRIKNDGKQKEIK